MTDFSFLKRNADRLLRQTGLCTTALWNGAPLVGTRSMMKRQDAATLAGDAVKYDFSLLCPASEFTAGKPEPLRDIVEIDGVKHLVLAVDADVAGNLRLHLGSQYG